MTNQTTTRRRAPRWGMLLSGGAVWLYAATLALPLYYLVISAFKTNDEVFRLPLVPTFSQGFTHFADVWTRLNVPAALLNSVYITLASIALTLLLAVPAAYALARSTGRVASAVERLLALGFLIPGVAALLPTLLLSIFIGLYHTREFLILYHAAAAQPLAVILLLQFMRTVPPELEESAKIDGAGRFQILRLIYLPLVMGGVATVAILDFISFWNDYLFSLILVGTDEANRTLQVAMPTLSTDFTNTDNALIAAGTLISIIPVFLVYLVLNRRMENALAQGAVKG